MRWKSDRLYCSDQGLSNLKIVLHTRGGLGVPSRCFRPCLSLSISRSIASTLDCVASIAFISPPTSPHRRRSFPTKIETIMTQECARWSFYRRACSLRTIAQHGDKMTVIYNGNVQLQVAHSNDISPRFDCLYFLCKRCRFEMPAECYSDSLSWKSSHLWLQGLQCHFVWSFFAVIWVVGWSTLRRSAGTVKRKGQSVHTRQWPCS